MAKLRIQKNDSIINYSVLRDRLYACAYRMGKESTRLALTLFYVLKSSETKFMDKILIVGSLSYILLPIDILSARRVPIIGWIDELSSLAVVCRKVQQYITPEIETKVEKLLSSWFPELIGKIQ